MMIFGSDASTCGALCGRNCQQPKQRGHHNHRPGGTSQANSALRFRVKVDERSGRFLPHWNDVPSIQMQCRMTANFRATATCAFFIPLRLARRRPQAFREHQRYVRCSKTLAASKR